MEIKNGFVQWDDRKDIPCMFAEMEDGTRYYFKQELQNGNRIVTTSLLEFVDPMSKKQNIGLLGPNGNIVIPCNNSSIQVLGEDLLLVEPAEPISENVKETNRLRQDPLAATRLVSTPAQIKEKMNAKMGPTAKYEAYDQFKDVTLCDGNGNNYLGGEYYSFVAIDGDKLYLAKNYADTEIKVFSIPDKKIIEKEIKPIEEIVTEPVVETPVEEVATGPVVDIKTTEEVAPNRLDSIYENDLGEEVSIPTEEVVTQPMEDINVSFNEITEETPTEEISEESTTDVVNTYEMPEETDTEKRLKALNELFSGANSNINSYLNSDEEIDNEVFSNTEFHEDKIESIDENEISHIEREPENTKELFDKLMQEKADADRELSEAKEREEKLLEENEKDKREIKSLKQKLSLVTSTLQDAKEAASKQKATIESLTMTLDLQKRKSEEYKRDLIEKDREIDRLRTQKDDYDYIRSGLESLYGKEEDSYYKVA